MFAQKERLVDLGSSTAIREPNVSLVQANASAGPSNADHAPPRSHTQANGPSDRRLVQRADLERLRRRLAEPCELAERDLLTLLAYAIGGDGDPIIGLLDDTRATIGMLGELPAGTEPTLLLSLERRLAVALELYARATAGPHRSTR